MSTLVLLRHGESLYNRDNLFTGWQDVDLSQRGVDEAAQAGGQIAAAGIRPDVVHTSLQLRATRTAELALGAMGRGWLPVRRHWRLNERHYGDLETRNKAEILAAYGEEQFHTWRRGYTTPPPPLAADDPRHPRHDPRYHHLAPDQLPASECLRDVVERMLPYWHDAIVADLRAGLGVLVSAHGNSLRALVKHLDAVSDAGIVDLNIPTGVPLVYDLDPGDPCLPLARRYLGDPELVRAKTEAVAHQGR